MKVCLYLGFWPLVLPILGMNHRIPWEAIWLVFQLQGSQNYLQNPSCQGGKMRNYHFQRYFRHPLQSTYGQSPAFLPNFTTPLVPAGTGLWQLTMGFSCWALLGLLPGILSAWYSSILRSFSPSRFISEVILSSDIPPKALFNRLLF